MLIDPQAKLEKVTGPSGGTEHPYLDAGRVIATNGSAMAIVPCACDDEPEGFIPAAALKESRKLKQLPKGTLLADNDTIGIPGGAQWPRPNYANFPNWRRAYELSAAKITDEGRVTITINAHLLWCLAQALGGTPKNAAVTLSFCPDETGILDRMPIFVKRAHNYGLLMSMTCGSLHPEVPEHDDA